MMIQPMSDNIVIKIEAVEVKKETPSGIILATTTTQADRQDQGIVIAVGTGRILNSGVVLKPQVEEGDRILFNKFAGTEIVVGDEKYLLIKESDILARIKQ